jgi:predicted transcriptional regulator
MVASRAEVERLRTEADTIFTRIDRVETALDEARHSEGEHWDSGLDLELETPAGETVVVTLDVEASAAENAQRRHERASELAAELAEREAVADELLAVPPTPLAVLVLYHLDAVEGDYPRSMAGHLNADRERVADTCAELVAGGVVERIESGMLKRREVKLKRAAETHQHHTYYRLSRQGDHLLRYLAESEGRAQFLRWIDGAETLARRLSRGGPDYPRMTAEELDAEFERVRRLYRAMARVGLVETYDGSTIKASERKLKPKDETHRKHTYYVTTDEADRLLRDLDSG